MSSIKIRSKRKDGKTQIRTLIAHPMETGRNRDKQTGELIATHHIKELIVRHNDNIVAIAEMGAGISRDPYFAFMIKGGEAGDKITISWEDSLGNSDSADSFLK